MTNRVISIIVPDGTDLEKLGFEVWSSCAFHYLSNVLRQACENLIENKPIAAYCNIQSAIAEINRIVREEGKEPCGHS